MLPTTIARHLTRQAKRERNKTLNISKSLIEACGQVHLDLGKNEISELSGATCCAILFKGRTLYAANLGDSRAILVNDQGCVTPLTFDQTPDEWSEQRRILESGGTVHRIKSAATGIFRGPARVWLPNRRVPGLAMSRSIGDYLAHTVGVSATPVITEYSLQPQDQIIIIASDGVWEYLSNEQVGRIARKHYPEYKAEAAANDIVMAADNEWKRRGPVTDDITCVVVYLEKELILANYDLD